MLKEIWKEALKPLSFAFREFTQLLSWLPLILAGHFIELGTFPKHSPTGIETRADVKMEQLLHLKLLPALQ